MEKVINLFESESFYLKRIKRKDFGVKIKISTSKCAEKALRNYTNWEDSIHAIESFYVIGLKRDNTIVFIKRISTGGIYFTAVDIKIIGKLALSSLCASIIIAHNHPSGNEQPSNEDKELTKKIKLALSYFDISLIDHLIMTEDKYLSFADNNLL